MASTAFTQEELLKQQDEVLKKLAQEAVTQGGTSVKRCVTSHCRVCASAN